MTIFHRYRAAFSMVEVLVALVLLAVGLLGLAAMTQVVMKGNDNANHLSNATDVCQFRIEELKDLSFDNLGSESDATTVDALEFGATLGQVVQETDLNSQGLTDCDFFDQESQVTGSACDGVSAPACTAALTADDFAGADACWQSIKDAGPYVYTRSFAVCSGREYASGVHPAGNPTVLTGAGYSGEINCQAEAGNGIRPEALTCLPEDILNPGSDSNEKMIKILCSWRKRDGRCGFVNFSALRTDL